MTEERNIQDILAEVAGQAERTRGEVKKMYRSSRPAVEPSQVYSIRIPVSRLGRIRALAKKYGMAPTAMLRTWILERLDAEERAPGSPSPDFHNPKHLGEATTSAVHLVVSYMPNELRTSPNVYERKVRDFINSRHRGMAEL